MLLRLEWELEERQRYIVLLRSLHAGLWTLGGVGGKAEQACRGGPCMWSCTEVSGSCPACSCQAAGTEGVAGEVYRCSEGGHSEEAGEAGESSTFPQFTAEGSLFQLADCHVWSVCEVSSTSWLVSLQASLPVQELLGMPLNRDRDEMKAARLLPV